MGVLTQTGDQAYFATAVEQNAMEAIRLLAGPVAGGSVERRRGYEVYHTGIPYFLMNGLLGADLPEEEAADVIQEEVRSHKSHGLPFMWLVGPSARPAGVGDLLERFGLEPIHCPGMWIATDRVAELPPLPPGVEIGEVLDLGAMEAWVDALARGMDLPPLVAEVFMTGAKRAGLGPGAPIRHFLARKDGQPAACSSLIIAVGQAGIYDVGTVPEARRMGIGAAITNAAITAGRDAGLKSAVLDASSMGAPVYKRLGFQTCCTLSMYTWHGDLESAT